MGVLFLQRLPDSGEAGEMASHSAGVIISRIQKRGLEQWQFFFSWSP